MIAVAAAGLIAAGGAAPLTPKRFAAVEPGRLYRSGEPSPRDLAELARGYGIRTVLCLLNPDDPAVQAERRAARRLGLSWVEVPLRGNGDSTPADRQAVLRTLLDDRNAPVLVHCAAGTNRTGLAVGLYRLLRQGWTLDQAMAELRLFDFDDLPKHENLREALREAAGSAPPPRAAGAASIGYDAPP